MSLKRTGWVILVSATLLVVLTVGCGTDSDNPLKQPGVYRDPQVRVTRAPTEIALDPSTLEAGASATVEPVAIQPPDEQAADDEQFLMDEIEGLFDKIERKLDQTDVNP